MRVGPFETISELGSGGLGTVLRARDASGREVALKLLRSDATLTPQRRQRFLQEARAMARVRHKNVVGIVDVGEAPGGPWIAMELVPGETLAARLAREGPLPLPLALGLAEELTSAVATLHAAGLVHRDINPRNVLLRAPGGEPVLGDLGLARDLTQSLEATRASVDGRWLGTPGYWPPEQARGDLDRIGPAADVYALGATLYAMLTGEPPFRVETLQDALRVLEEDPRPPSRLRRDLPPAVDALVMRCLARQPGDRVASAAHLADALRVLRRRPGGPARRRRGGVIAGALLLLGAAAAGLVLLARGRPRSDPAAAGAPNATPSAGPPGSVGPTASPVSTTTSGPTPSPTSPPADPAEAEVLRCLVLARELTLRGDPEGAQTAIERALELDPEHPEALVYLATVLNGRGERAQARTVIERAIAAAPGQPRPIAMRGMMRTEDGDLAGGIADLTRSLQLDPESHLAWHNRACALLAQGDPAAALADEEQVLRLAPGYAPGHWIRASALRALGQLAEAEEAAGRALTLRPGYGAAWLLRAHVRAERGDLAGAREDARRALEAGQASAKDRDEARELLSQLQE